MPRKAKTVDRGIVLMAGEAIQAANLKQAYVSHSRFEESHVTSTTDRRAAMDAMATPADRALAIEIVNEITPSSDNFGDAVVVHDLTLVDEADQDHQGLGVSGVIIDLNPTDRNQSLPWRWLT
jgi:hypothetical protein